MSDVWQTTERIGNRVKSLDTTDLKMNLNGWTSRQSQPVPTTTVHLVRESGPSLGLREQQNTGPGRKNLKKH